MEKQEQQEQLFLVPYRWLKAVTDYISEQKYKEVAHIFASIGAITQLEQSQVAKTLEEYIEKNIALTDEVIALKQQLKMANHLLDKAMADNNVVELVTDVYSKEQNEQHFEFGDACCNSQ